MTRIGLESGNNTYWFDQHDGWFVVKGSLQGGKQSSGTLELQCVLAGISDQSTLRQKLIELRAWERRQRQEEVDLVVDDGVVVERYRVHALIIDDTPVRLRFWEQGLATVQVRIIADAAPIIQSTLAETIVSHVEVPTFGTVSLNAPPLSTMELVLEHDETAQQHPGCYTLALTPRDGVREMTLRARDNKLVGSFIAHSNVTELVAVVRGNAAGVLPVNVAAVPPFTVVRAIAQPQPHITRLAENEIGVVWGPQSIPPGWTSALDGLAAIAVGPAEVNVPTAEQFLVMRGVTYVGEMSGAVTHTGSVVTQQLPGSGVRLLLGFAAANGYWSEHGFLSLMTSVAATPVSLPYQRAAYLTDQNTLTITTGNHALTHERTLVDQPLARQISWRFLVFAVSQPSNLSPNTYFVTVLEEPQNVGARSDTLSITVPRYHALRIDARSPQGYPIAAYVRPLDSQTWYRTPLSESTTLRQLGTATPLPTTDASELATIITELVPPTLGLRRAATQYAIGQRELVNLGSFATEAGVTYDVHVSVASGSIERMFVLDRPRWLVAAAAGGSAQAVRVETNEQRARVRVSGGNLLVQSDGSVVLTHASGWWTVSAQRWVRQALDAFGQGQMVLASSPAPARDVQWNGQWLRRCVPYTGVPNVLGIFTPVPPPRAVRVWIVYRRVSGSANTVNFTLQAISQSGTVLEQVTSSNLVFDETVRATQLSLSATNPSVAGYVVLSSRREDLSYVLLWGEDSGGNLGAGIYNGSAFGQPIIEFPPVVPGNHGRVTLGYPYQANTIYYAYRSVAANALHGDAEYRTFGVSGIVTGGWAVEPGQPFVVHLLSSTGGTPQIVWRLYNGSTVSSTLSIGVNQLTVPENAFAAFYQASTTNSTARLNWVSLQSQPASVEQLLQRESLRSVTLPVVPGLSWAIALRCAASSEANGTIIRFMTEDGANWELTLTASSWDLRRSDISVLTVPRQSAEGPVTVLLSQVAGDVTLMVGGPLAWQTGTATITPAALYGAVELQPTLIEPAFAVRWLMVVRDPETSVVSGDLAQLGSNDPSALWGTVSGETTIVYDPMMHPFAIVRGLSRPGFARGALALNGPSTLFVVPQHDLLSRTVVDTTVKVTVRGVQ